MNISHTKKNIKLSLILLFATAMMPSAFAQKQAPPAPSAPKDFVLPGKKESVLPNGLKSVLIPYGRIPLVYVSLIVKTGMVNENANQVWLSKLLASLMDQGTQSLSATELARKTASMGGSINVSASGNTFTISGSALSQYAPELIDLISQIAMSPRMPSAEMDRLKSNLKRQLTVQKNVPQSIAQEAFAKLMYGSNVPYGRTFPTEEMINGYTLDEVKQFYNENIGAKRSGIYVAGVFNEKDVNKMIDVKFASWKSGAETDYPKVSFAQYTPQTVIINRKGAPQTTVMMGLPTIDPKNPDYTAFSIMNSLLGGSFGSRITSNIRENKGYTYSPGSMISTKPGSGIWYENADITSEHTIDAIHEIKKEITRLANEPPSTNELLGIQRYEAGIFVLMNSMPASLIQQLSFLDIYGLDESYLTNHVKNIYAVTPQQVSGLVKEYLNIEKMSTVMVGDEAQIKAQQEKK